MKINKKTNLIALGLTIAAAFLVPQTPAMAAEDKVLATVNGKTLTEKDLQLADTEIGNDLGKLPAPTKRRVLVEYLIENQLFADAAEAQKMSAGEAFTDRMAYYRRRALRELFFESNVKGSVSETAAKAFYTDQIKQVQPEDEVQARHILVPTEEEARDMLERVNRGDDFAEVAKKHSKDPGTKVNGGMLGYFSKGQMVPAFEQAAFALKKGDVSQPVKSRFGWHIIKLEDRRIKPKPTFEQVKETILNSMIHRKAQSVAADLRDRAKIEYVDEEVKKEIARQAELEKKNSGQAQMMEQIKKMQQKDGAKTP